MESDEDDEHVEEAEEDIRMTLDSSQSQCQGKIKEAKVTRWKLRCM